MLLPLPTQCILLFDSVDSCLMNEMEEGIAKSTSCTHLMFECNVATIVGAAEAAESVAANDKIWHSFVHTT